MVPCGSFSTLRPLERSKTQWRSFTTRSMRSTRLRWKSRYRRRDMSTLKGVVEVIVVDMAITALEIGGTIGEEGRMAATGGIDTTGAEDIIEQGRGWC